MKHLHNLNLLFSMTCREKINCYFDLPAADPESDSLQWWRKVIHYNGGEK